MIDATFAFAPARDIAVLDLWDGEPPPTDARMIQVEPRRWWLVDAGGESGRIAGLVAGRGAVTPVGGGMMRATIAGPGWRTLLTLAGLFDAEDPAFAAGAVSSTVIHHVPVRIVATGDETCEVYCTASYAQTLRGLWRTVCKGG